MTIIEEISSNDITDLHLSDVPEEYFEETKELIKALSTNESLESVTFDKDFLSCVFGKDRGLLLSQVSKLPKLKEVTLGDAGLLIGIIEDMVKDAKELRSMTLERVIMQGIQSDFDSLEAALHAHKGIKEFIMTDCLPSNEGINMEKLLDTGKNTTIDDPAQSKKSAIAA
jgi:hypothetical protein